MPAFVDLAGHRYGRLIFHTYVGAGQWKCVCDCGTITITRSSDVKQGRTRSCGCFRRDATTESNTTHSQTGSREYVSWNAMWQRCTNPARKAFPYYGGRGITICARWKSFECFLEDMGPRPPGMSLERRKTNLGYRPSNCYWATPKEQALSRRSTRWITHNGQTKTITQWALDLGYSQRGLSKRLAKFSAAQALRRKPQT